MLSKPEIWESSLTPFSPSLPQPVHHQARLILSLKHLLTLTFYLHLCTKIPVVPPPSSFALTFRMTHVHSVCFQTLLCHSIRVNSGQKDHSYPIVPLVNPPVTFHLNGVKWPPYFLYSINSKHTPHCSLCPLHWLPDPNIDHLLVYTGAVFPASTDCIYFLLL